MRIYKHVKNITDQKRREHGQASARAALSIATDVDSRAKWARILKVTGGSVSLPAVYPNDLLFFASQRGK